MSRPQCTAPDGKTVGYDSLPCDRQAVALFREDTGEEAGETKAFCMECLLRAIRISVDLRGLLLSVVAEPESADHGHVIEAETDDSELPPAAGGVEDYEINTPLRHTVPEPEIDTEETPDP